MSYEMVFNIAMILSFHCRTGLQGMQDRKAWNESLPFPWRFYFSSSSVYYFPSLKVHCHAKVPGTALAVPVPQEEGVAVGWCLPGCSAQPCPAPRAQLWGRAGFGGMPAAASATTQCWSVRFGGWAASLWERHPSRPCGDAAVGYPPVKTVPRNQGCLCSSALIW